MRDLVDRLTHSWLLCSGVNLAEARNDEKYGQRNDYKEYKAKTPLLFPFL